MLTANQNPKQLGRDKLYSELLRSGWLIQNKSSINLAGVRVAVRKYQTNGPADHILFVNKKPVGVIEAKREEEGTHLTMHKEQTEEYEKAKLGLLNNEQLHFAFESADEVTCFANYRDPKRSRPALSAIT